MNISSIGQRAGSRSGGLWGAIHAAPRKRGAAPFNAPPGSLVVRFFENPPGVARVCGRAGERGALRVSARVDYGGPSVAPDCSLYRRPGREHRALGKQPGLRRLSARGIPAATGGCGDRVVELLCFRRPRGWNGEHTLSDRGSPRHLIRATPGATVSELAVDDHLRDRANAGVFLRCVSAATRLGDEGYAQVLKQEREVSASAGEKAAAMAQSRHVPRKPFAGPGFQSVTA